MELKIAELAQNRNTYLLHVQAFISDYVVMTLSRLDVNRVLLPTLFGLRVWSRGLGLSIPSRVSPLILHTQAESGFHPAAAAALHQNTSLVNSHATITKQAHFVFKEPFKIKKI